MIDEPPPSVWLDPLSRKVMKHGTAIVVVAVCAAGFGIVFRWTAARFFEHVLGAGDVVSAFEELAPWQRLPLVAAGGLAAGLASWIASRHVSGQGVGGVMEAVALGRGKIGVRSSLWKALGCWVAIVTGSSIGREGPIIQFGAAIASSVASAARMAPERTRILIAAGSAAGFAAAYNTPFAAVLFVLEIVVGVVTTDVVLSAVLAAAIATTVTRLAIGGGPIYGARTFSLSLDRELVLYVLLGGACGVVGAGFNMLLAASERGFTRLPLRQPLTAALGGIVVGAIATLLPDVTGNGYEVINRVLDGRVAVATMLVLLVAKSAATAASVGSGTPGGAFTPSLFLGAALGGAFGDLSARLAPALHGSTGAYALVGMAALCASTTHAPLMASVLVFELSGDYSIVLPLLLTTATATLVSRRLRPASIYMDELRRRGIGWQMTWSGREVEDVPPR